MPMFANTDGVLIKVFALLHWSFAHSKLVVAPSLSAYSSTSEAYPTTLPMDSNSTIAIFGDTSLALAPAPVTEEDDYTNRDSRYLNDGLSNTNSDMYKWRGITQPQHPQTPYTDYAYSANYAMTSPAVTNEPSSTYGYPYLTTTQKPVLRHLKFRPQITKLQVKAIRRRPSTIKDMFVDSDSFEEPDTDFVPLVTLYGSQISRWSTTPTRHVSQYTQPGKTFPSRSSSFGSTSTGVATSSWSGSGTAIEDLQEAGSSHHHHYHRHVPTFTALVRRKPTPKLDLKKIGILALVKIGLAKLKAFGVLKLIFILLLKLKLFLLAVFIKFVLFLKLLKVLKSLLIPLIVLATLVPLMLGLLAVPILLAGLAPVLYSLLTMLPIIPIVNFRPPKARVQLNKDQQGDASDTINAVFDQLLSSTQCIERIACQMATKKEATLFFPFIKWYLHKVSDWLRNDKLSTYVDVYTKTVNEYKGKNSDEEADKWCTTKYVCEKSDPQEGSIELKQTPDRRAFSKILNPPKNYTGWDKV